MRKFRALSKLLLIDYLSRYRSQLNAKNKFLSLLLLLVPIFIALPIIAIVYNLYTQFATFGQPELTLTYVYVVAFMLMLISAIPMIIAVYFFSKDLGLLSSLPISRRTLIVSKMTLIYMPLLVIALMSMGPAIWFISQGQGFKLTTLALGSLALLLGPVAPMAIAIILVMPLMRLVSGHKNRKRLVYMGNFTLILVVLGFQISIARLQTQNIDMIALFTDPNGFLYFIGQRFYPSIWLTRMVLGSFGDALLVITTFAVMALVALITSDYMLSKSLTAYNQASVAPITAKGSKQATTSHGQMYWLIRRYLGIILHNPTFLLQISLTLFLPVLMLVILSLTGEFQISLLKSPELVPFQLYVVAGMMITPSLMGTLSATAITREGKTFWETMILPIPVGINMMSRVLASDLLTIASGFLMGTFLAFWLGLPLVAYLMALVFTVTLSHFFSVVDLFINIKRPYLNWTNPTAAIKNNLNIMLALVLRLIICAVGYLLFRLLPTLEPFQNLLAATILISILNGILHTWIYPKFVSAFNQIEI